MCFHWRVENAADAVVSPKVEKKTVKSVYCVYIYIYKPKNITRPHTHPKRMNKLTGSPPPARVFFFPFPEARCFFSFILFSFPLAFLHITVFFSLHHAVSSMRMPMIADRFGLARRWKLWWYIIILQMLKCVIRMCSSNHVSTKLSDVETQF